MSFDIGRFWRRQGDDVVDDGYSELLNPITPVDAIASDNQEPEDRIDLRLARQQHRLKISAIPLNFRSHKLYAAVALVLLSISIAIGAMSGSKDIYEGAQATDQSSPAIQQSGTNEIKIKAPSGVDQLQGTKSSLDAKQYTDNFYGANVNVAIQQLPDNFKTDPNALTTLATSLKATQKLQTSKWGTAYMLTSGDIQVIVFANQTNLVILQSMAKHSSVEWIPYIDAI